MTASPHNPARHTPPRVNQKWFDVFAWYGRWYLGRHFHGVRLSTVGAPDQQGPGLPALPDDRPVVVYCNHPSWWDPMILIRMTAELMPGRTHYAPIDAAAVEQYKFFEKIGFFGIAPDSRRGAVKFLRVSEAVLSTPNTALWVSAEGHFADVRERPVALRPGVAHLAARMPELLLLPVALEYAFWDQPKPEALVRCGEPIDAQPLAGQDVETVNQRLADALAETMDALAGEVKRRDPGRFATMVDGGVSVSLVYDAWRSLWARLKGQRFSARHRSRAHRSDGATHHSGAGAASQEGAA